ncbi:MAG: hypothetical protein PHN69_06230 [Candidatus Pacebacteria bacterium]|nr:hypothetical protein [Candidatus Paceibacterota bacterium]
MVEEKYDYVGHVIYPYCKEVISVFMKKDTVKVYTVKDQNKTICSSRLITEKQAIFLENAGYQVSCNCVCKAASKQAVNKIPIKAYKVGPTGDPTELLVLVKARDLKEFSANTENLVEFVRKKIGIKGQIDVYGKMEMC